jgi:hypothetical protein
LLETLFVRSETLTFEYERLINVALCPGGHCSVVASGLSVRLAEIDPFFPELNVPNAWTVPDVAVFFGSEGTLRPPLTHESVRLKAALAR